MQAYLKIIGTEHQWDGSVGKRSFNQSWHDLNVVPNHHLVDGKNSQKFSSDFHTNTMAYMYWHVHQCIHSHTH